MDDKENLPAPGLTAPSDKTGLTRRKVMQAGAGALLGVAAMVGGVGEMAGTTPRKTPAWM